MMKKNYTAPEAKLLSFISAERLANDTTNIDFDDLVLGSQSSGKGNTVPASGDISLPLT